MTRHTTILAGRGSRKRAVRVEHKRREAVVNGAARDPLRLLGTVIVADALGFADALGGVMTGERLKALARRKGPISSKRFTRENASGSEGLDRISMPKVGSGITPSNSVGKRDIGCAAPCATETEIPPVLSTGLLIADVCRQIDFVHGKFRPVLIG